MVGHAFALRVLCNGRLRHRLSRILILAVSLLFILVLASPMQAFAATPPSGNGSITVTLVTPAGVPANVALVGKSTYYATKAPTGTTATIVLSVSPDAYHVVANPVTSAGRFYTAAASMPEVPVSAVQSANLKVQYTLANSASDFHATTVGQTSIALAWTASAAYRIWVDRTTGTTPESAPGQGTHIPVLGSTANDSGLQPSTQYTYSLFTQYLSKWVGPMVLRVGTANAANPSQAVYVANPDTLILKPGDVVSASTTGGGVHVVLGDGTATPLIGAAVILPILPSLPGGFLGTVTAISTDGHGLDLVAGGLSDAFDYYSIHVPDISTLTASPAAVTPLGSPKLASPLLSPSSALSSCLGGSGTEEVQFTPSLALAGHFNGTIDKYIILGVDIPQGASLDMAVAATVSGAASVKTSATLNCSIPIPPLLVPITTAPVPISFYLDPIAQFTIGGALEVSNLGVAVTGGVQVSGHIGLTDGASFSASPIMKAVPLTPSVTANGAIGLKVGGQVIVGPGAGTPDAGVIAGLGGELDPIDASFGPVFSVNDANFNACLQTKVGFTRSLSLTAKAWLGNWDITKSFTLDALNGSTPYFGSPWYLPSGCQNAEPQPSSDLLGAGVTKIDDTIVGGSTQWGHLDGFAPGHTAWVLSTGNIADVIGSPSQFDSTNLGEPGDAALSALSGEPTFDAASYTVTLVPTGSTLHVKYVFASEEYPEYVGSAFNDVMAVFVNGVNCATVPGTNVPVSVNTVNDHTNSAYYVDNGTGAAGYATSMDGLTVPLTCSVPVTPGVPVTVKIAVADSSDGIYDSAVALLDKGIWSD